MAAPQTGLGAKDLDSAYLTTRVARASEIDELGHVNNAVYVSWIQDIAVEHWYRVAPPALAEPFVWVCRRHEIDYRAPVHEGDTVEMRTWLGEVSGASFDRHTDIRLVGATRPAVIAKTTWVMLDKEKRRPRRIGQDVLETFGVQD